MVMKTLGLICVFSFVASLATAQATVKKPEKFGNAVIDKYIDSVYGFIDKQKSLSGSLNKLEADILKAKDDEDEDAIDGLIARFTGIETSYKALDDDSKKLGTDGATAAKASSQCGAKAPKCAEGVKAATNLLKETGASIVSDKLKIAEIKAKAEAAKKSMEKSDG